MKVEFKHITNNSQEKIIYDARISSKNRENKDISGLLNYCIRKSHWSPFEMATMSIEIETSRAISAQIIRHKSFNFQEFSQRYSEALERENYVLRLQDEKNRQNSIETKSKNLIDMFDEYQADVWQYCYNRYLKLLQSGAAKECARFILPMETKTGIAMTGTIRSWIHYLEVRTNQDTQKEHRDIADACVNIFKEKMPLIYDALRRPRFEISACLQRQNISKSLQLKLEELIRAEELIQKEDVIWS